MSLRLLIFALALLLIWASGVNAGAGHTGAAIRDFVIGLVGLWLADIRVIWR